MTKKFDFEKLLHNEHTTGFVTLDEMLDKYPQGFRRGQLNFMPGSIRQFKSLFRTDLNRILFDTEGKSKFSPEDI